MQEQPKWSGESVEVVGLQGSQISIVGAQFLDSSKLVELGIFFVSGDSSRQLWQNAIVHFFGSAVKDGVGAVNEFFLGQRSLRVGWRLVLAKGRAGRGRARRLKGGSLVFVWGKGTFVHGVVSVVGCVWSLYGFLRMRIHFTLRDKLLVKIVC